jgi:hypothetical protein
VKFTLPYYGVREVNAALFDGLGRLVWKDKMTGQLDGGVHQMMWNGSMINGRRSAAGVYIMRLTAIGDTGKMVGRHEIKLIRIP